MNHYSTSATAATVVSDCQDVHVPNTLFLLAAVTSLAENLLVVLAVMRTPKLHTPMYLFICNLAAFNTLSSMGKAWETAMMAFHAAGHLEWTSDLVQHLDNVVDTIMCASFFGSFCSFWVIAVDRYITIFHALRYHVIVTVRRTVMVIGMTWTVCGIAGALMIRFANYAVVTVIFTTVMVASMLLILPLYAHMFLLARKHAGHIASLPGHGRTGRAARAAGSMQAALTLTTLFGVFIMCWAPLSLHLALLKFCPQNPYCQCYFSWHQVHLLLAVSHAIIDPTIYAFRSKELRCSFQRLLRFSISWVSSSR
ncbi:adrenocorticotropic hormone receptor [Engraulis encrasicolus]|uniref:adrenocorticotropic hormone receptor n=1 Tax=Engraulis encrasicolus TaxID=184585 RepID=UPI002FD687BF